MLLIFEKGETPDQMKARWATDDEIEAIQFMETGRLVLEATESFNRLALAAKEIRPAFGAIGLYLTARAMPPGAKPGKRKIVTRIK